MASASLWWLLIRSCRTIKPCYPSSFNIPLQSGKVLKLPGKGIPSLQGYGRGDQLVVVRVETPSKLTSRQKELLEEFAREAGEDIHPMGKSFFDKVKELFG